jgi:hypothetical protein
MALEIIHAGSNERGIYIGGWNIAPDGYLIHHASSFDHAWETLIEHMHDNGYLAVCDCEQPCDYDVANGVPVHADDVVMRIVRPMWCD